MGSPRPTDHFTRLLLKAQKGDSKSFGELYAVMVPHIRKYITSLDGQLPPSDHDDLVQETVAAFWRKLPEYRGEASAMTFVLTIARNLTLKNIAMRQRLPLVYAGDLDGVLDERELCEPPDSLLPEPSETQARIQRAMAHLTGVQRQAIELSLSHDSRITAAKEAGCTPVQFADRVYKGRKCLRRILSQ